MWEDPIVEEVHTVREAHAAKFNSDLQAIYWDVKAQEKHRGRTFVAYPPKRISKAEKASTVPEA